MRFIRSTCGPTSLHILHTHTHTHLISFTRTLFINIHHHHASGHVCFFGAFKLPSSSSSSQRVTTVRERMRIKWVGGGGGDFKGYWEGRQGLERVKQLTYSHRRLPVASDQRAAHRAGSDMPESTHELRSWRVPLFSRVALVHTALTDAVTKGTARYHLDVHCFVVLSYAHH